MAIGYERTWHDQPRAVKVKDFEKERRSMRPLWLRWGYGKGPAFPGVQAFVAEDGSAV